MDEPTAKYYVAFSAELAERYEAAQEGSLKTLRRAFTEGMRVLDVGAGSGRDAALLLDMGCDAYAVEPCENLRASTLRLHPELTGRLENGALPQLSQPFGGAFDGVLCCAVLMHLPRAEILDAAIALRNVLKENGRLLLSIPVDRPGLDGQHRDEHGRLFTPLPPDYLSLLFERIGFQSMDRWQSPDSLNRGYSWCNFLFQARHPGGSHPLDQIESILNRDRKTATYKLALLRALSEIATTEYEQARWVRDGIVGIPIDVVCEKWLYYYWPITESASFIPQIRGESETCRNPIAFRSSLMELVEGYRRGGGLTRFALDYRAGSLSRAEASILTKVLSQIRNTIVSGPVTYAGGSLESGRVFRFDGRRQEILMSAAIWRELSLVGHWIQDAVVLRWAELTSEISGKRIRPSEAVELLLTVPIPERNVTEAKTAYTSVGVTECTWSGDSLRRGFEVDHIIPFALWRNNDLWNLVPASHRANAEKRDKLPTRELMVARRDHLAHYWGILRAANQARFDHEICRVAGVTSVPSDWQSLAFQRIAAAVEYTAAQRGSERWPP